jgi:hypothetical protein
MFSEFYTNPENGYVVASGCYASSETGVGHREFQELDTNSNIVPNDSRTIPISDLRLKVNEAISLDVR